jgi:hypothetical protein
MKPAAATDFGEFFRGKFRKDGLAVTAGRFCAIRLRNQITTAPVTIRTSPTGSPTKFTL